MEELRFSNYQSLARKLPVDDFRPIFTIQGSFDIGFSPFGTKKGDATSTTGAADFCCFGAVSQGLFDQMLHLRGCHSGRESFPIRISDAHYRAHLCPIVSQQSLTHAHCGIPNAIEEFKQFRVAINVTLEDVPVISSRKAGLAGVADRNSVFEFCFVDLQRFPLNPCRTKMYAGGSAVEGRIIILETCGHPNHRGFYVGSDGDEPALVVAISYQAIEGADAGDRQC